MNLVVSSDSLVFAAASQSSKNIPMVVPFETDIVLNHINSWSDKEVNSVVLNEDNDNNTILTPNSTFGRTGLDHYFYNFNGSNIVDSATSPLSNNQVVNIHPSDQLEEARNQYVVLLKPADFSASSSGVLTGQSQGEIVNQQKDRVRMMAAQAAREGGQITRIYENLDGYAVRAPPDDPRFIERLRNDPRVAHVEQDQVVYALLQSLPTGINRIDADLSNVKSGDGAGSVNVDVAVLDSGIDPTHPDLNVYRSKTFVSGTSSAKDDNGHGTFVAGIIGAKDDNVGVVGVVPGARLWAVKVLDKSGSGLISDIIAGIDYIVQNAKEIDAANLSFGCECSSSALNTAINKAVSAGITFAVAAGNNAKNANSFSPANNPNVIAVSAITDSDGKCGAKGPSTGFGADDRLASFSNYGTTISIGAPGVEILTTSMNGGYAKVSGTSIAAPHVAGAAALYKAANPNATPSQVKSALIANAVKSSVSTCDGNGFGYFSGDKDTSREPFLYLKGTGPTSGDSGNNAPIVNRPPTVDSKSISVKANVAIDVILSGNDPDNDPISFSVVDLPKNGQLSTVSSNTVRYVPKDGFMGQDSFTYVSRDDKGTSSSNKGIVSLTVSQLSVCETLDLTAATASGDDGNVPSNVLDKDFNTRWSNLGHGSWIQVDLGSKKSICSVDIAWYLGNQRQNNFIISVSDDGTTFTQKHSGTSSGTTTSPEKYTFTAPADGRYVRITVNGNTQNDWASITEIAAFGDAAAGGGSPVPTDPGPMYHRWQNTVGSSTSWSAYQSLGGNIASKAAAALNPDGRLEIFVIAANNQLYHRWQTTAGSSNSWSAWTSLGGNLVGDPAVAVNSDGRLEVFAVSAINNQLYHRWQTTAGSTTAWSTWTSLGGTIKSSPAVIANQDGRLEVFAVSANNQLYHKWQNTPSTTTNSWSAYQSLGGTIKGDPAVARNNDGRLDVFVIGANGNALYHKWQNTVGTTTNSWSAYQSLGGNIKSDPAVAVNSGGRLEVFVVSANNQLYHKWQNTAGTTTNSWSAYHSLGGSIKGDPDVARNNDGRLEVFVIGANGNALYNKWQNTAGTTTSWSAYQSLGGALKGDPSVARNADGKLETFVIGGGSSGGDAGTNDKFGIKKIYASKPGGEQWYMNMPSPTNDPRFNTGGVSLTKNADGYSYKVESTQVRLRAFTSSGYNPNQITTLNQQQLATKGYMQSPNDWKNVEITGYFKVNSHTSGTANGGVHIVLSSRGGTHSSSAPCEGTAYHSNLYQTGTVKFQKELRHSDAYASNDPQKSSATNTLLGRGWFGFKAVVYTSPIDGSVKLEQYIDDTANNNWRKLLEFKDNGNNWFVSENLCGGTLGQMISWGGPWALFRWDNIDDMDIKDLSVREIVPPSI